MFVFVHSHLFCSLQIRAANLSGDCSFVNEISRFNFGLKEHHQVCLFGCVLCLWYRQRVCEIHAGIAVFRPAGVCSGPSAALHPRRTQGEPRGGGASGWRGVWQLFPWPRPLRPHPTQQERRQVCPQGLREPRPILRKPLTALFETHRCFSNAIKTNWRMRDDRSIINCAVRSCSLHAEGKIMSTYLPFSSLNVWQHDQWCSPSEHQFERDGIIYWWFDDQIYLCIWLYRFLWVVLANIQCLWRLRFL